MNELAKTQTELEIIESVVIGGDLEKLKPEQRVRYYMQVCNSLGLNPFTKPFDYIKLDGKLVLYAKKDATDQIRKNSKVSVTKLERERMEDIYIVTAYAEDRDGRQDSSIGAVSIGGLKGKDLANAIMKAETKAKRRVTLSICGLGILDETELDTVPTAKPVIVTETGEIIEPKPELAPAAVVWNDNLPQISYETACGIQNSKGQNYGDLETATLAYMHNSIMKRIRDNHLETDELDLLNIKLSAIQTIIDHRNAQA